MAARGSNAPDKARRCTAPSAPRLLPLAVDVLDDDAPNKESTRFLLMLAASAKVHACVTGIDWGLSPDDRDSVRSAIASRSFDARVGVGWDPCHVQIGGISVVEARNGARP